MQCFRCGKHGHKTEVCHSNVDVNNQPIRHTDQPTLKTMPFKANFKLQHTSNIPKYPNTPNSKLPHYKPQKRPPWNHYPSQQRAQQMP